jgi:hypothetical protein
MAKSKNKYEFGPYNPEMRKIKKRKASSEHPVTKELKKSGASKRESKLVKSILKGRS